MAEFPALPLWTDAYLGDTTHLTTIEHGAYLLLLMTAWRSRDCALPDDDRILARYARCGLAQWKKLRPILEPFFTIKSGRWTQGRLNDEYAGLLRKREIAAANGRASALKRKGRHSAERQLGESEAPAERELQGSDGGNLTTATLIEETPCIPLEEKKPTKRPLPADWEPADFGEETQSRPIVDSWSRLEFERQLERFRAHHRKEGSRYADWQSAWSTWVLNSVRFAERDAARDHGGGQSKSSSFVDVVLDEAAHAGGGKKKASGSREE